VVVVVEVVVVDVEVVVMVTLETSHQRAVLSLEEETKVLPYVEK